MSSVFLPLPANLDWNKYALPMVSVLAMLSIIIVFVSRCVLFFCAKLSDDVGTDPYVSNCRSRVELDHPTALALTYGYAIVCFAMSES